MPHLSKSLKIGLRMFLLLSVTVLATALNALAQAPKSEDEPVFNEYRGVQLGWLVEQVHKKLGSPSDKSEEQDFYVFDEKETLQILYDKSTHKVVTISVDFSNGARQVLTPQQVFGADIEAKPDGSKYKLVRYPKAGYWLSYSRTPGDSPLVSVTIQKLQ